MPGVKMEWIVDGIGGLEADKLLGWVRVDELRRIELMNELISS